MDNFHHLQNHIYNINAFARIVNTENRVVCKETTTVPFRTIDFSVNVLLLFAVTVA